MILPVVKKILVACLLVSMFPSTLLASEITIRPFLIDAQLAPRESKTEVITLTNDYPTRKAVLFATVNEITIDSVGEIKEFVSPVMTDRTNTVTSWIEIGRGRIEIEPGETVEVPITIKTHPFAEPGEYHVFIGLVEASKRNVAEAIALAGDADGVIVKVVIADERKDNLKIASFLIDRFVTGDESKYINIEVENLGDLPASPQGEIIFYDSRGVEVDSIEVNGSGVIIEPGETAILETTVPLDERLGRYKANVSLQYGLNQRASLFDTTYFYMLPLHILLGLFGVIVAVSLAITLLFRRVLLANEYDETEGDVLLYVKDGHDANPQEHDIDLTNKPQ